jgi:hypothetical protein
MTDLSSHLRDRSFSNDAVAYVESHLADDPLVAKMLARLTLVADELADAGLDKAIGAAIFLRALDSSDAKSAVELPFELDATICEMIDGAQSSPAMQRRCTTPETRQVAALLNTVRQICRQKTSYAWADELLRVGPLKTYVQIYLSVIDDNLARVSLALNDELRFLPRLDTQQDRHDPQVEHQTVIVASLVMFWVEDGASDSQQVHCAMSERYGAGWARVVRFARQRGFPIHDGFQAELLGEERIDEVLEGIEQGQVI